jgi:hypothetical protein
MNAVKHFKILTQVFSVDNPDSVFQNNSCLYKSLKNIVGTLFIIAIMVLIYFSLIGYGILTTYIWYHDEYSIFTGCLLNQTCTRPNGCFINNNGSFYGFCFLKGTIYGGITFLICIILGWLLYSACIGLSTASDEFKISYERTMKRYNYEEIDSVVVNL